jgi:NAD-dependent SIR2 family protein deacetylase
VHGQIGLYKCIREGCTYATRKSFEVTAALTFVTNEGHIPTCPACGEICPPQILQFDEDYESHEFYCWNQVQSWLRHADAIVFVGTSASVTATSIALKHARENKVSAPPCNQLTSNFPTLRFCSFVYLSICPGANLQHEPSHRPKDAADARPRGQQCARPSGRDNDRARKALKCGCWCGKA